MNIPPGLTSYIQVLDVCINKLFKDKVRCLSEHIEENIDRYANGKVPVAECRILMTKWVADAWGKVDPAVICGFKKCSYSVAIDGSENDDVNIERVECTMPNPADEEEYSLLDLDDDDESSDSSSAESKNYNNNESSDSNSNESSD